MHITFGKKRIVIVILIRKKIISNRERIVNYLVRIKD